MTNVTASSPGAGPDAVAARLDALRAELAELAYALDRRGQPEAADVAVWASGRLAELRADLSGPPAPSGVDSFCPATL